MPLYNTVVNLEAIVSVGTVELSRKVSALKSPCKTSFVLNMARTLHVTRLTCMARTVRCAGLHIGTTHFGGSMLNSDCS